MSEWVQVILALIGLAGTGMGVLNTYLLVRAKGDIKTLEKNTNSKLDKLVEVTGQAEFAKGLKQGEESRIIPGGLS